MEVAGTNYKPISINVTKNNHQPLFITLSTVERDERSRMNNPTKTVKVV